MVAREDLARPVRGSVLVIEDDRDAAESICAELRRRGFEATVSTGAEDDFQRALKPDVDVVLAQMRSGGTGAAELCARLSQQRPGVPVVLLSGQAPYDAALIAQRAGAWDVLSRPWSPDTLALAVERAVRHRQLRAEVTRLRRALQHSDAIDEVVGESAAFKQVREGIERTAASDSTVLITGEGGVGKERVARSLHQRSARSGGPFIAVNCASMPEGQLESELFGHSASAMYTDASGARTGQFVRAEGGTLFLDEIGELPLGLQPKLVRALQERRVRPVGSDSEVPFNARIVAATSQSLEALVRSGRFRDELFFRLGVLTLEVPPLRARGKDVLLLAQRFIQEQAARTGKEVSGLTPAAAERLLCWTWPGNVRELYQCIERAVTLASSEQISVEDLPEKIRRHRGWQVLSSSAPMDELVPIAELERRYILHVLEVVGGSRTLAARTLGMDRKTLYRRLEQYGVPPEHVRRNEHTRVAAIGGGQQTPPSSSEA